MTVVFGQQPKKEINPETVEAIKNDIWVPFMEAYDQGDSSKLKSIHSKDIVRVTIAQNQIETGAYYLDSFGNYVQSVKEKGDKINIAFAILSTAIDDSGNIAYQTGYYRFSSQNKGNTGQSFVGYGFFNVGLRRENGTWKIWLDSDNHTKITADQFNNAPFVYDLNP
ncbi:hypothetical protein Musp01_23080 [Muricauda sp. NBRC 101325]|nr:hypothetical protein Musp01_23080 [Muricauda sp. NBRC 101325]